MIPGTGDPSTLLVTVIVTFLLVPYSSLKLAILISISAFVTVKLSLMDVDFKSPLVEISTACFPTANSFISKVLLVLSNSYKFLVK